MRKLRLDRDTLAKLLQGNQLAIATFERVLKDVGETLPGAVEEANVLAGAALSVAQSNSDLLLLLIGALEQTETAPVALPVVDGDDLVLAQVPLTEMDDTSPRAHLGTISSQDADRVDIAGGLIDATPVGSRKSSSGAFTTLTASGVITCTSADAYGFRHLVANADGGLYYAGMLVGNALAAGKCGNFGFVYNPTTPAASYFHLTPLGEALGDRFKLTAAGALTVGAGFGCNGKSAQAAYALGPAATDAASTQTLANNLRAALIANGIGS